MLETALALPQERTEDKGLSEYGQKKYSRMVRMYKEGYLSVVIYKNVFESATFYDIVLYRKIKGRDGNSEYKRGANLKPDDLPLLQKLLQEAHDYLRAVTEEESEIGRNR